MPESIKFAWTWLGAQNAALPYLLTTLTCLFGIDLWKHIHPKSWHRAASLTPFAEEITKAQELAHNFLLALPTTLGAGFFTWLASGGDLVAALLGAVAGAGAPLTHHVRKLLASLFKKPPGGGDGGDQKPVGVRDHIVLPDRDGEPLPPPSAAIRSVHPAWRLATVGLLAFVIGSAFGLTGCSPSAMQAQRDASNVVAHVANDTVKPMLVAAFKASGKAVVDAEPNRELAQYKLTAHVEAWKPVWAAWATFKAASDAWQAQLEAGGDGLAAAAAARDSYCKLRVAVAPWQVELPDFPGPLGCPAGGAS